MKAAPSRRSAPDSRRTRSPASPSLARYVAAEGAGFVDAIDLATQQVVARIPASLRTNGIVVDPDGRRVFASSCVIDVASNRIVKEVAVGKRPWNMAITRDGRKLYVACGRSNAVAVIDTARMEKMAEIAVGKLPWGVAIR